MQKTRIRQDEKMKDQKQKQYYMHHHRWRGQTIVIGGGPQRLCGLYSLWVLFRMFLVFSMFLQIFLSKCDLFYSTTLDWLNLCCAFKNVER
jgi:hypothetical protein